MSKPQTQSTKKTDELEKLYRDHKFDHLQKPIRIGRGIILTSLLLAIIFGLVAGFGGGLFVLITRTIPNPFGKGFNLDEYLPSREITVQTREEITVTTDERIANLAQKFESQVVKILPIKTIGGPASDSLLEQIYLDKDILALGAILTSDGWIITTNKTIGGREANSLPRQFVVVDSNHQVYPVKQIVRDSANGIVFLKIEAQGLAVVKLAEEAEVTLGQEILTYSGQGEIIPGKISHLGWQNIENTEDLIKSSDKFFSFIKLSEARPPIVFGSPVINLDGSVVGIVTTYNLQPTTYNLPVVIPTSQFKDLVGQVLRTNKINRPYLGIDYIDISETIGITDPEFKDLKAGALVYGLPAEDSPAGKVGLKNRDVILKVNQDRIDARYSLTKLIHEYRPGDEVELTILRGGKEQIVKVKLGELTE